jgi:hypothetical protein
MVNRKPPAKSHKRTPAPSPERPLWEELIELANSVSDEDAAKFPRDGARNLHHYLHGAPKQDPD